MTLELPPTIDVPSDARSRIEATVLSGIRRRQPRTGLRAAGAAVATIAVAAGVTAAAVHSGTPVAAPASADNKLPASEVAYEKARCTGAADKSEYPSADAWQPIGGTGLPIGRLTVYRAEGKVLFCETTKDTVTLSPADGKPVTVPGSAAKLLLSTKAGTVAGIKETPWTTADIASPDGVSRLPAFVEAGLPNDLFYGWVANAKDADVSVPVWGRQGVTDALVRLTKGEIGTVVHNPPYPPGDRTSARGKLLADCMTKAGGSPIPDAATWEPGAVAEAGGERVIMASNPRGVSACYTNGRTSTFYPYLSPGRSVDPDVTTTPALPKTLGGRALAAGIVRGNIAGLTVNNVDADTLSGTYAVLAPEGGTFDDPRYGFSNYVGVWTTGWLSTTTK